MYGGYQPWIERAGRFRSLGDGKVDFNGIFSKLTQYGYDGWAVLEWECCIKHPEQGAAEGAPFIQRHLNIGYNRAAKLIEQMEKEGVVGPANHVGKREVLIRRGGGED